MDKGIPINLPKSEGESQSMHEKVEFDLQIICLQRIFFEGTSCWRDNNRNVIKGELSL